MGVIFCVLVHSDINIDACNERRLYHSTNTTSKGGTLSGAAFTLPVNHDLKECHFDGTLFLFTTKSKIYAIIRKIFQEYLKNVSLFEKNLDYYL